MATLDRLTLTERLFLSLLVENHRSRRFDHSGMRRDPNLAFPIDRVRRRGGSGRSIGGISR